MFFLNSNRSERNDSNKQNEYQKETDALGGKVADQLNEQISDQLTTEDSKKEKLAEDFLDNHYSHQNNNKEHLADINNNLNEQLNYSGSKQIKDESEQETSKRKNRVPDPDAIKM